MTIMAGEALVPDDLSTGDFVYLLGRWRVVETVTMDGDATMIRSINPDGIPCSNWIMIESNFPAPARRAGNPPGVFRPVYVYRKACHAAEGGQYDHAKRLNVLHALVLSRMRGKATRV